MSSPTITVAAMNAPYRRFRAELRMATRNQASPLNDDALAEWMKTRSAELARSYIASGNVGGVYEFAAYVRRQYMRSIGLAP